MRNDSRQAEELGETAREFLREADANFLVDDYLSGSHRIRDAATYAVIAVCQHRNWPCGNRADLDSSVRRLASELRDAGMIDDALTLEAEYIVACNSHISFYHRDMDLEGGNGLYFAIARRSVHRFVERMLAISESADE